jgi:acetylornithine/succinyldiaminopimelate/putrescine aminotransferase
MPTQRQLFLNHVAQTSDFPLSLEIEKAAGIYMYDTSGKQYIDLIAGISVSNVGHCHPKVVKAIQKQAETYMHLMVFGEYIQNPQVALGKLLSDNLPSNLESTYFVNSGSEAIEGALKLAKRYTGRHEIIAFRNAYHGSTQGALSVMGNEDFKRPFRPLLPGIKFLDYGDASQLNQITEKTACVLFEPIQGEAGVRVPSKEYIQQLARICKQKGALLIADEIQTGFGRTGKLFGFQNFNIEPDIIAIAKGMGGGMPIGGFVSSNKIMVSFKTNPVLGHISTFGGHPVSCAASIATLQVLLEENLINQVEEKSNLIKSLLKHPKIKEVRGKGLILAVQFDSFENNKKIIDQCISNGVITDWFLFCDDCMRIAPPLTITKKQIEFACAIILKSIDEIR